jgi:transcriptional regulator with XRE-family HTH domain
MLEMSIHQKIRAGRAKLGMTEQQFADAVGVTRGAVQQWEKEGGTAPTRKNQPKVAELLGISVAELMEIEADGALNRQERQVYDLLKSAPFITGVNRVTKSAEVPDWLCKSTPGSRFLPDFVVTDESGAMTFVEVKAPHFPRNETRERLEREHPSEFIQFVPGTDARVQRSGLAKKVADLLYSHPPLNYPLSQTAREREAVYMKEADDLLIPQFETGGAMGDGLLLRDQPGIIRGWSVNREWISKNLKNHTGAGNLCIVTGFGDSMKGMYNSGDPLVVDTGVKKVEYDAVYFFRVGDEGFIKRLQRIPGEGLVAISENKAYRDWTIKPDMDFEVFGRVLKAWKGEDF